MFLFKTEYYGIFCCHSRRRDGRFARSARALLTCIFGTWMRASRNVHMHIYGAMWHGISHSRTNSLTKRLTHGHSSSNLKAIKDIAFKTSHPNLVPQWHICFVKRVSARRLPQTQLFASRREHPVERASWYPARSFNLHCKTNVLRVLRKVRSRQATHRAKLSEGFAVRCFLYSLLRGVLTTTHSV